MEIRKNEIAARLAGYDSYIDGASVVVFILDPRKFLPGEDLGEKFMALRKKISGIGLDIFYWSVQLKPLRFCCLARISEGLDYHSFARMAYSEGFCVDISKASVL